MDQQPDQKAKEQEYIDVVRHMRGDDRIGWGGFFAGGVIGAIIGGLGSLFFKGADIERKATGAVITGLFGASAGVVIESQKKSDEMDAKAAKVLFAERIKREQQQASSQKTIA